jgi:hypothetical protein
MVTYTQEQEHELDEIYSVIHLYFQEAFTIIMQRDFLNQQIRQDDLETIYGLILGHKFGFSMDTPYNPNTIVTYFEDYTNSNIDYLHDNTISMFTQKIIDILCIPELNRFNKKELFTLYSSALVRDNKQDWIDFISDLLLDYPQNQ